jgi:hypothetical protein
MKLISPIEYSALSDELNEFVTICNKYNYRPSKEEFQEVINFLLLFQSGTATLCESYLLDSLYEEKENLFETTYNPEKDYDSASGIVGTAVKATGAAALAGAIGVGMFVQYLFKKGKVKAAATKEADTMTKKLQPYEVIYQKRAELAKLKGETFDGIGKLPGITEAPALPEKEKEK